MQIEYIHRSAPDVQNRPLVVVLLSWILTLVLHHEGGIAFGEGREALLKSTCHLYHQLMLC